MKTLKIVLNQAVDIIFALIATGLLISHFVHLEMLNKLATEITLRITTGKNAAAQSLFDEFMTNINNWQEAGFLLLVVGYVINVIINKVQIIKKAEHEDQSKSL